MGVIDRGSLYKGKQGENIEDVEKDEEMKKRYINFCSVDVENIC